MGFRDRLRASVEKRLGSSRLAHASFDRGLWGEAMHYAEQALAELAVTDSPTDLERIRTTTEIAEMRILLALAAGRIDDAGRAMPLLRQVCEDGLLDATVFEGDQVRVSLAVSALQTGDYSVLPAVLDQLGHAPDPSRRAFALRARSMVAWRTTADLAGAAQLLEQSVLADPPNESGMWWHDAFYRAEFLADAGRYDEAAKLAAPAIEQQARLADPGNEGEMADLGVTCGAYARILARVGDLDSAREHLERGSMLLSPNHRYAWVYSYLATAVLTLCAGDEETGIEAFDTGTSLAVELGITPTVIELLTVRMELALLAGDHRGFDRYRRQALDLARMLGHVADQRRIESLS